MEDEVARLEEEMRQQVALRSEVEVYTEKIVEMKAKISHFEVAH